MVILHSYRWGGAWERERVQYVRITHKKNALVLGISSKNIFLGIAPPADPPSLAREQKAQSMQLRDRITVAGFLLVLVFLCTWCFVRRIWWTNDRSLLSISHQAHQRCPRLHTNSWSATRSKSCDDYGPDWTSEASISRCTFPLKRVWQPGKRDCVQHRKLSGKAPTSWYEHRRPSCVDQLCAYSHKKRCGGRISRISMSSVRIACRFAPSRIFVKKPATQVSRRAPYLNDRSFTKHTLAICERCRVFYRT